MTKIRVQDYLDDQDADDLYASGVKHEERTARRHRVDNAVRSDYLVKLLRAQEEAERDGAKESGE